MPAFDTYLFNKKGERKYLTLLLADGEDILGSIKQGMKENNLKEATVEDIEGIMKEGTINFMEGNGYKVKDLKNEPIFRAHGSYKLNYDQIWGNLHVVINKKSPITGSLVRGKAAEGTQIKMSFLEIK